MYNSWLLHLAIRKVTGRLQKANSFVNSLMMEALFPATRTVPVTRDTAIVYVVRPFRGCI